MSDNMTTVEVVNMWCSMQHVTLTLNQRDTLANLIQKIFESGCKKCDGCQCNGLQVKDIPHLGGSGQYCGSCCHTFKGPRPKCDGCKTLDPLDAITCCLPRFGGDGLYCKYCQQAHELEVSRAMAICDGCKTLDPSNTGPAASIREYDKLTDMGG